jgi:heme-degrading monooxygenase HmoA
MVLEHAVITVRPDTQSQFEAALGEARRVISAAPGFGSLQLHRGIENDRQYVLLVEWESVEAHVEGFRQSERFAQWRALIGPFFDGQPEVTHLTAITWPT